MTFDIDETVKVLPPRDVTGDSEDFTTGTILEKKWNMYRIKLANGQIKWIPLAYLEKVKC